MHGPITNPGVPPGSNMRRGDTREECSIGWTHGRTTIATLLFVFTTQECIDKCNTIKNCIDALYAFGNNICVINNIYDPPPDVLHISKRCLKISVNLTLSLSTVNLGNNSSEPNSYISTVKIKAHLYKRHF
ncbi:hypothetical protein DPMN_156665 [Dreissena polymorpha]|uniref:Apple domain-containing protein n=1 Tax=Dreissena polymorpha TaxID=45954 RepID=A0A9D4FW20_DREPO|nr:hypothetical protein DPMN_156665 [Dreissena polymorpha]